MQTIDELIAPAPIFAGLDAAQLELIAGCARNEHVAGGRAAAARGRAGRPLLPDPPRHGRARGPRSRARRAGDRDARRRRGRRLVVAVRAVPLAARRPRARAVRAGRLRRRLPARQVRGRPRARLPADAALRREPRRPPAGDAAPAARRLWPCSTSAPGARRRGRADGARAVRGDLAGARTPPTRGRSSSSAELGRAARVRARAVHDALGRRRRRGADLDQRRPRPTRTARAHGPRGRAGHRGDLRVRARPRARRPRPVRRAVAGRARGRGRGRRDRRRRHRLAPLRPAILRLLARRERYGRLVLLYGGRSPDQLLYADELEPWAERGPRGARDGRQRRAGVARPRRRRHPPDRPRRTRPAATRSRCRAARR